SVQVALDNNRRPVLSSGPTIRPAALGATDTVAAPDYRDVPGAVRPSPAVVTNVTQWAHAYLADDREQLKILINGAAADGQAPRGDYIGLGGRTRVGQREVVSLVPSPNSSGMADARVRLVMVADGANGFQSTNEYDVLIARYQTNDPRVVA